MFVSRKTNLLIALLLGAISPGALHAEKPLAPEVDETSQAMPILTERSALEQEIYGLLYEGVAPVAEREKAGGAFGIAFGQPFDSAKAGELSVVPPAPHPAFDNYHITQSYLTKTVYEIKATKQFGGFFTLSAFKACTTALENYANELKTAYPKSFTMPEAKGLFLMMTADVQITLHCTNDHQLEVLYAADYLGRLATQERRGFKNINPNVKPFFERDILQPEFGVQWDKPYQLDGQFGVNDDMFTPTPKEPSEKFDIYKLGVTNYSHKPWLFSAEKNGIDEAACIEAVNVEAESMRTLYPYSFWEEMDDESNYKFRVSSATGMLSIGCQKRQEQSRLIKIYIPYISTFGEESMVYELVSDAVSTLLGEPLSFARGANAELQPWLASLLKHYQENKNL